jgi:hypothetical protein
MTAEVTHLVRCAAAANGCLSTLAWKDQLASAEHVNEGLLLANGWRKDHGRWICSNHPAADTESASNRIAELEAAGDWETLLACGWCLSEVRVSDDRTRVTVAHAAGCTWYPPTGQAGRVPCGVRVTHRGPYRR